MDLTKQDIDDINLCILLLIEYVKEMEDFPQKNIIIDKAENILEKVT